MIRSLWPVVCLLFGFATELGSQPACFLEGNAAYGEEKFSEAIAAWEACLSTGEKGPSLHYNLGNAHLQLKSYARAILHYEKALLLGGDEDTMENLRLARSRMKDEIPEFSDFFLVKAYKFLVSVVHSNVWVVLTIAFLFGTLWLLYMFWSRQRFTAYIIVLFGLLTAMMCMLAFTSATYQENLRYAIIMERTDLYTGSDDRSEKVRGISSGNKVRVIDSLGTWIKVELPDKERGWIDHKVMEAI